MSARTVHRSPPQRSQDWPELAGLSEGFVFAHRGAFPGLLWLRSWSIDHATRVGLDTLRDAAGPVFQGEAPALPGGVLAGAERVFALPLWAQLELDAVAAVWRTKPPGFQHEPGRWRRHWRRLYALRPDVRAEWSVVGAAVGPAGVRDVRAAARYPVFTWNCLSGGAP